MKKNIVYLLGILCLAFVASVPLILPFFKIGFFPTHDGEWAVVRLSDMYRGIKDLQFPVRFSEYLNFQYGYPLFNFAYPLPYYLGLIFVFLKLGFVNSIKILFSLSVILSFLSMFYLSSSLWKNRIAGLVSAIFYIYVPYRLVDLFVRGSLGESLSFVLFPLIALGIKKIYEKGKPLDIIIVGILYALLITTHNIMTILFGLLIIFIVIIAIFKKKLNFLINLILSMIISLFISAFFWIPAIFEKHLILLSKIPIADRGLYFVKPMQLIVPQWGYGVPTDPSGGFGYQIGLPQLIVFVLVLIFALKNIKKTKDAAIALMLLLFTVIISFLLFSPSAYIWKNVPLLSEINYPWTLLAIIMFAISLAGGYLCKLNKLAGSFVIVLSIAAVILLVPHAKPDYSVNRGDSFYTTNQATTTSSNELMPLWVKKMPSTSFQNKIEVFSGNVSNYSYSSKKISFWVDLPKSEKVRINTIYYPGWEYAVDGEKARINYDNQFGVVDINVLAGKHLIKGEFKETPLRLFGDFLSLSSLLGIAIYLVYSLIRKFINK